MDKTRLEAFSDGVIAIIITIMVLELRTPEEATWRAVAEVLPTLGSYLLSFVSIGIYWNNHHHLLKLARTVDGRVLWTNLHLLFWLSLVPFITRWMDESGFQTIPVFLYGVVMLCAAIAYVILQTVLVRAQGPKSHIAAALGSGLKGRITLVIYVAGCIGSFVIPAAGIVFYAVSAMIWFIPDRRIERAVASTSQGASETVAE